MNITLLIPMGLRQAVEGRSHIDLALPPSAGVGEVLETLLLLYPKLRGVPGLQASLGEGHAGRQLYLLSAPVPGHSKRS